MPSAAKTVPNLPRELPPLDAAERGHFEMTGDYTSIVPVIIAVACAIGMRRIIIEDNIYTMKLVRRGLAIPKERNSHMFTIRKAREVMAPVTGNVKLADLGEKLARTTETWGVRMVGDAYATVEDAKGHLVGVIAVDGNGVPLPGATLVDDFTVIQEDAFLNVLMRRMARRNSVAALVLRGKGVPRAQKVIGVVHRGTIGSSIINEFNDS